MAETIFTSLNRAEADRPFLMACTALKVSVLPLTSTISRSMASRLTCRATEAGMRAEMSASRPSTRWPAEAEVDGAAGPWTARMAACISA